MTTPSDALPRPLTLAEWDALGETPDRLELVAGYVTVVPSEQWINGEAQALLVERVRDLTGRRLRCASRTDVLLFDVPPTVREPDVVVLAPGADPAGRRLRARDVLLVAEIVAPSSVETDWITKRREYAAAGIPHYVVADVREGHHHIAAFTDPVDGVYTRIDGGASITLHLAGHDVPVAVTDLLPH